MTRTLLLGGLVPIIVFTVVEEKFGTVWGLVSGMIFGAGEMLYEYIRHRRVETITWIGNGMLLTLGGISLLTSEGIWFKLQPAIMEAAMGVFLLGSSIVGKPFMLMMSRKQGTFAHLPAPLVERTERHLGGFNIRLAVFFLVFAVITVWASLYWSTRAWLFLKGIGFNVALVLYGIVEVLFMRRALRRPL